MNCKARINEPFVGVHVRRYYPTFELAFLKTRLAFPPCFLASEFLRSQSDLRPVGLHDVIKRSLGHLVARVSLTGVGTHSHQSTRSRAFISSVPYTHNYLSSL